ncbi:MAG: IMP dehydrogenase [Acidobacteria bacterium]|nr:IMP dehydrogenase [Acidobacteriota bacterium]
MARLPIKTAMKVEKEFLGKTFDDFLLRPQRGLVSSRRQVDLTSRLSRHYDLSLPIVSANMDSVTGGVMAQALALEGGVGIIHRGMSIEEQAREVGQIKRSHGYIVEKPFCLPRNATIREARLFTRKHHITGILIEEALGSQRLAGLLSNRDMPWFEGHEDRRVEEFMTPVDRLVTGSPGISMAEAERMMFERRIEKLPLVDKDRHIRGLISKKDLILTRQRPYSSKDKKGRLLVGAAVGAHGDYLERAAELIHGGADILVIDIAHGHSDVMKKAVEAFRKRFAETELICGNVGTGEGAAFLKELGADGIKVGIGPGRGCRTRLETASGVPQLQAIREAWCAIEDSVPLIADGGIKDDKDIFMALICGASSVMLGSMLSGTDEAPGHVIVDPASGQKKKLYRGMTSPQAVLEVLYDTEHPEDLEEALATPAEGQEMQVPYKGSVVDVLRRIRGHLASSVSYAGGGTLCEVRAKVVRDPMSYLIVLSEASRRESYER